MIPTDLADTGAINQVDTMITLKRKKSPDVNFLIFTINLLVLNQFFDDFTGYS